jgi:D-3-phosphoglycerate dehydrogenase
MKIFISTSSFAEYDTSPLNLLKDAGLDIQLNPYGRKLTPDECLSLYQDIDGLIAGTEALNAEILKSAKNLKVISRCGTGLDNVDINAARDLGIKVFTTPDAPTQAVAELTVGLILSLLRRISLEDRTIRNGGWAKNMGNLLSGKTLGILGLGRIGRRLVELTQPFNLKYIAWDNSPDRQFADRYNVEFAGLDDMLARADIVTIHLPYAPGLKDIISERELGLMKPDALLVNAARGGLVNEASLYTTIKEKRIGGAAIDVFEREPYTGPLTGLDNIILTSHIGSYAQEARVEMELQAARNLLHGLDL